MAIKHGAKLTAEEKIAIRTLERLQHKWPPSLWLFAADGTLNVMKKNATGERIMAPDGGYDPDSNVARIDGIEAVGGDW